MVLCAAMLAGCAERAARRTPVAGGPLPTTVSGPPGMIPAGTVFEIRTNEAIKSDSAAVGRTYQAEMARDLTAQRGEVLIPMGSPVQLIVLNVSEGGRISEDKIELGLRSITVNGKEYAISTGSLGRSEGIGANQRTAEMVGGGALLGTLIGASAGGGKGAAIGAAAGAAAGAAVQVLTRGKEVRIPAESVLTFRLNQPLQLERGAARP